SAHGSDLSVSVPTTIALNDGLMNLHAVSHVGFQVMRDALRNNLLITDGENTRLHSQVAVGCRDDLSRAAGWTLHQLTSHRLGILHGLCDLGTTGGERLSALQKAVIATRESMRSSNRRVDLRTDLHLHGARRHHLNCRHRLVVLRIVHDYLLGLMVILYVSGRTDATQ